MTEIENLIYQFEGQQREIMLRLHDLLTNEYNLTSKITFGCPSYYGKSWICYLKPPVFCLSKRIIAIYLHPQSQKSDEEKIKIFCFVREMILSQDIRF